MTTRDKEMGIAELAIGYDPSPTTEKAPGLANEKTREHTDEKAPEPADLEAQPPLNRLTSVATSEYGPPPDGGWRAWITCICAHCVFICTWGLVGSFGVFQAYYADFLAPLTPSTISWIGSIQSCLAFFVSAFSGRISDAGHFHLCFWTGMAFQAVGIFGASFSTRYWQLMLSQGVCIGLATGFLACPTMSVMATYFDRRRGLAIGILTSGNVNGGLIFPAMVRQLLPVIGFGWTLRAIGFMQMGLLLICGLLVRTRLPPSRASGPILDVKALLEPEYGRYISGMFFNMAATFIMYFYISSFGRTELTPTMTYAESLNLLMIMQGTGLIGRISAAHFADYVGPLNIMSVLTLVGGLFSFTWIAVHGTAGVYVWTALYGIVGGAVQALFPTGLASLSPHVRQVGQRIGMGFSIIGFAMVSGPPSAGAIITRMHGSFVGTQVFAGALYVVGALLVMSAKAVRMRRGSKWTDKI